MNQKYCFSVGVFHEPPGEIYDLLPDTYTLTVCDICGKKVKCDFFVPSEKAPGINRITGFDCCRTCRKKYGVLHE